MNLRWAISPGIACAAIDEIQATLRHRSVQTTMGYVHTRNPRRVGAVRKAMDESVKLNARAKAKLGALKAGADARE